jgi:rod shape-determining protein MreD
VNSYRRELPLGLLASSMVAALVLMLLSVPEWIRFLRPDFVALLLIFWLIRTPEHFGMGFAWTVGFVYDATTGSFLGQHALSFSLIAYIVLVLHQRIFMFGVLQQTCLVLFLLILDQLIDCWVAMVIYGNNGNFYFLINAMLGALCWPAVSAWLNSYQRSFSYGY